MSKLYARHFLPLLPATGCPNLREANFVFPYMRVYARFSKLLTPDIFTTFTRNWVVLTYEKQILFMKSTQFSKLRIRARLSKLYARHFLPLLPATGCPNLREANFVFPLYESLRQVVQTVRRTFLPLLPAAGCPNLRESKFCFPLYESLRQVVQTVRQTFLPLLPATGCLTTRSKFVFLYSLRPGFQTVARHFLPVVLTYEKQIFVFLYMRVYARFSKLNARHFLPLLPAARLSYLFEKQNCTPDILSTFS